MKCIACYIAIIAMKTLAHFAEPHVIFYIGDHGRKERYKLTTDISLWPESIIDVIYVFPVFSLSFMCHFNIPQVHSELTRPTRWRMRVVLVSVVTACYILYCVVAFFDISTHFSIRAAIYYLTITRTIQL